MIKLRLLILVLMVSIGISHGATTSLTINPTATGWATTSGATSGDLSVTNAANRGYAVFDLSTLSIPSGSVISGVTLTFTIGTITGASTPTCNIYGYTGDISSLSATSRYAACSTGTAAYTATWGTATGAKVMASTTTAVSFVTANLSSVVSFGWVLSASTRAYSINGTTSPVPVLTVTYCNAPTGLSISQSPNPVCAGSTVTLTSGVLGATTYYWAGPSGFTSTARNPAAFTTSTASAGVYTFVATSMCGSSDTVRQAIALNTLAPGPISGPAVMCGLPSYTFTFTDTVSGGVWTSSSTARVTINPTTGVATTVTAGASTISYNTGCGSAATFSTAARAIPSVSVNNPTGTACYGASVSITASGGTTYSWSPAAGLSSSTATTVTATPTTTTTYTVTGTSSGCSTSATSRITGSADQGIFSVVAASSPSVTCTGGASTLYTTLANSSYNTVSSITYSAVSTAGTSVLAGEDDNYVTVTIPFNFNFYGVNYTSVNICSNGFINFGSPTTDFSSISLPDPYAPEGLVALFQHDMDLNEGGNIKYQTLGSSPNRRFVVSYNAVGDYGGGSTNTGQIILYETSNMIDILIANCMESAAGNYVTTGVQDLTGSRGVAPATRNSAPFDATNEAWRFTGVPTSGYLYSWSPAGSLSSSTDGMPLASPITTATTFTVTVSDSVTGCYKTATTTVNTGTLTGTISPNTSVCTGTTAMVILSGPGNGTATYKVNGGSPVTVSLNLAGVDTIITGAISSTTVYSLISVGSGSCSQAITGQNDTITAITPPTFTVSPATSAYCFTSGVTLTATGSASTYTWSPATELSASTGSSVVATPSVARVYTVTGAIGSCATTRTATVNLGIPFTMSVLASPTITCSGGSASLSDTVTNTTYFNTVTPIAYSAVSTAGTSVLSGTDDDYETVSIPFTFYFYGNGYSSLNISTNGYVNFGTESYDFSSYVLPDGGAPEGLIALFMHDLELSTGTIRYQTLGTAPNRKFVISYNSVPDLDGSSTNTGQIILYETLNYIDLLIGHSASDLDVTVGVQDMTGSNGVAPSGRNGVNFVANNEAYRITGRPTGGYSYSWAPAATLSSSTVQSPTASGITSSTVFTVTATDATTGCINTATATVNVGTLPGTIAGTATICAYTSTNITFTGPAGATATYTVNGGAPQTVLLNAAGTAVVTYGPITVNSTFVLTTITSGICVQTITGQSCTVTVNPAAGPISGSSTVCVGSTITLNDSVSGGTWSSSAPTRASVTSGGVVRGVATGSATISYLVGSCTAATKTIVIQSTPGAITPATAVSICALSTTTLANATSGGTWSSSNTALATVDSLTGVVAGVSAGSVTITYSNGCGTPPVKSVTVNTMPASITGTSLGAPPVAICTLSSYNSFTDSTGGGTWSNTPTTVGTINSSGVLSSGTATGTTTISYTIGTCGVSRSFVVGSTSPTSITGATSVCANAATTLANATTGGVWSSSNTALATVNGSSGVVTGINGGSVTISYSNGCGSPATLSFTVNGSTPVLSADTVCSGTTLHLTASVAPGTYSWAGPNGFTSTLQNPSISGVSVLGAGTYLFSTTSTTGSCTTTGRVFAVVDSMPNASISASPSTLCAGGSTSLATSVSSPSSFLLYAIPYNPISVASGTNGPIGDDAQSNVTLPFTFTYFGTAYTTVHICTNGFINFGTANTDYSSLPLPEATAAQGMVALFWQDLNALAGDIKYTTIGTAPNRKFVVSFNSVPDITAANLNTGQIVLYETTNMIDLYIANTNGTLAQAPVCGLQNPARTVAITVPGENAEVYSVKSPGEAWRFVTPSYNYSWSPAASLSSSTITNPVASGLSSTTVFSVTARDIYSSCTGRVRTTTVNVNPLPVLYNVTGGGTYCTLAGVHIGLSGSDSGVNYQLYRGATPVGSPIAGTSAALDFGTFTDTTAAFTVVATNPLTFCTRNMTGSATITRGSSPTAFSLTGGSGCSSAITLGLSGSQTSVSYQLYNGATPSGSAFSGTGSSIVIGSVSTSGLYTVIGTGVGGCTTRMNDSSAISVSPTVYAVTGGNACSATGVTVALSGSQSGIGYTLYRDTDSITTVSGTGSGMTIGLQTAAGRYTVVGQAGSVCAVTMTGADTVFQSPSIAPGANPSVCMPVSGASLTYSGATGTPTTYNIAWNAAALTDGYINVTGATLGGSVNLVIPAGTAGSYTGTLTVANSVCSSSAYSFSLNTYAHLNASIISAAAPCAGYATNIVFSGTSGANIGYKIDGGTLAYGTLTGGTFSLSTGAITTPHSYTLYNASNPICDTVIDTTVVVNPVLMQWTGATDTNWNNSTNWSCGFVPGASDDVLIPVTANVPVIATVTTGTVRSITVTAGAAVRLDSAAYLNVKGNISLNGAISGYGTLRLNGASAQSISGRGKVTNFDLNNSAGASVDTASLLTIKYVLAVTSGTLNTNDSLVLYSVADTSARVAVLPAGASIAGNVKVMQFIQGGMRRYRFWSHPFSNYIGLSQAQNFIDITGIGGSANGFTSTTSNAPSAFRYDPYTSNSLIGYDPGWKPFTSTLTTADSNRIHRYQGIRFFIRGDKGEGLGYGPYTPSPVTISQWGVLNQGAQTVLLSKGTAANQDYNMIGNPYASPVDIGTVLFDARATGNVIGAAFYVWNASLGAAGQYMAIPFGGSASPYYLQANSCFQVRAAHDGDSLNFIENNKGNRRTTELMKTSAQYLTLGIYDGSYHQWDQLQLHFNNEATAAEDIMLDATKPTGATFNFYSLSADNKRLAIDARPYTTDKAIPLGVSGDYAQDFIIKVDNIPVVMSAPMYLHDKLLNQYVLLQNGTEYRFAITDNKASQGNERFELTTMPADSRKTAGLTMDLTPNPATEHVSISFTTAGKKKVTISIMDMNGVSVYSKDAGIQPAGTIKIPLNSLASGIYMVELSSGDEKVIHRLIKD